MKLVCGDTEEDRSNCSYKSKGPMISTALWVGAVSQGVLV